MGRICTHSTERPSRQTIACHSDPLHQCLDPNDIFGRLENYTCRTIIVIFTNRYSPH